MCTLSVCLNSFFLNVSVKNLRIHRKFLPIVFDWRFSLVSWLKIDSAAKIPLFIAVWVPLILGTFMKPGLQPISKPPGKVSFGIHWGKKESAFVSSDSTNTLKLNTPYYSLFKAVEKNWKKKITWKWILLKEKSEQKQFPLPWKWGSEPSLFFY